MGDKLDMIYDLLKQDREEASDFRKEVRQSHKETGEKLTKLESETSERLTKIEATNDAQNVQLAEHMRRTDILEDLHRDNEKRIVKLEEPGKVRKWMSDNIITVAKVAGAIMTIGGFIVWFFELL